MHMDACYTFAWTLRMKTCGYFGVNEMFIWIHHLKQMYHSGAFAVNLEKNTLGR